MGLFGFGRKEGHWIKRTHFFGKDTFECSSCGREFKEHPDRCPVAVLICAECSLLGKNSSVRMNSKRITSPGQVNKKRFTIGHEAGHIISNRMDRKEEAAFNHVGGIALQNTDGLSIDGCKTT